MALPRCPSCGSVIFPSAREGGDVSPLCEHCQSEAASTGHAGTTRRIAQVREEVLEPSGPFLLPGRAALPPEEVLEHLGTAPSQGAIAKGPAPVREEVLEPSGPFVLPGGPAVPSAALMMDADAAEEPEHDEDARERRRREEGDGEGGEEEAEVVVEPSGPFVVPSTPSGAAVPPVSLEASPGGAVDPYLHAGAAAVRGGIVRGAVRPHPDDEEAVPSIVVDPALQGRGELTTELPRSVREALGGTREPAPVSWTPLAIAFVAGMLAGAALVLAILRI